MRTWTRQHGARLCGRCGTLIPRGAPLLVISVGTRGKVRGECCAGHAPPDLPPLVARAPVTLQPFVPVRTIAGALPLDWRRRASGDREPGEEG